MPKFSANLGFLWADLALPDAILAAKEHGFDAVECHWPYHFNVADVSAALKEADISMLGLNTLTGFMGPTDIGVAAIPGREPEAQHYIDKAVAYTAAIGGGGYVHVMPGATDGGAEAEATFRTNLTYACDRAEAFGQSVLIEPINLGDMPGYHLSDLAHALAIIADLNRPNLKLMFDCYHIETIHGEVAKHLLSALPNIGHIQIAATPDRTEPDQGSIDYPNLLDQLDQSGYGGFVGAEYKPRTSTEEGLGWLDTYR